MKAMARQASKKAAAGHSTRARRTTSYRRDRYDEKIQQILRTAAKIFRRKGYRGTTLDEIAAELKMQKGNLYHYFPNKESILYTCHKRSLEIGLKALRHAGDGDKPPDERLRLLLTNYIGTMTSELSGSVVLLEEGSLSERLRAKIIQRRDLYERGVRQLISDGVDAGIFVACDPKLEGFIILGAVNWISKWYSPEGTVAADDVAHAFAERLVRGLLKDRRQK